MGKSALVVVLLVTGCASGEEEPADTTVVAYATVEDYCRGRAEVECSDLVVQKCRSKSRDACVSARAASCRASVPQGVRYVAAAGEHCIETVSRAYDDARLLGSELSAIARSCGTRMFAGPGEARAPCTVDLDCDGNKGLECLKPWGSEQGKCLVPVSVMPGGSCAGEADRCGTDFYCEQKTKVCEPRPSEEEPCAPGYMPCVESATCLGGGPFGGVCRSKSVIGEPCRYDSECASGACERPSGSPNGSCAEAITLSPLSDACTGFGT